MLTKRRYLLINQMIIKCKQGQRYSCSIIQTILKIHIHKTILSDMNHEVSVDMSQMSSQTINIQCTTMYTCDYLSIGMLFGRLASPVHLAN